MLISEIIKAQNDFNKKVKFEKAVPELEFQEFVMKKQQSGMSGAPLKMRSTLQLLPHDIGVKLGDCHSATNDD